jgi:hypothetical protein
MSESFKSVVIENDICSFVFDKTEQDLEAEILFDKGLEKALTVAGITTVVIIGIGISPVSAIDKAINGAKQRTWTEFFLQATGGNIILDPKQTIINRALQLNASVSGFISSGTAMYTIGTLSSMADGSLLQKIYLSSSCSYIGSIIAQRYIR